MPILAACACGFRFKAPDRLVGKKARCPKCSQVIQIPMSEAEPTIAEDFPATAAPPQAAAPGKVTTPEQETDEGPSALPPKEEIAAPAAEPAAEPPPEPPAEPAPPEPAAEAAPESAAEEPKADAKVPATGKSRVTQRLKRGDTAVKPAAAAATPAAAPKPAAAPAAPSGPKAGVGAGAILLSLVSVVSLIAGAVVLSSAKKDEDVQKLIGTVILVGGLVPSLAGIFVLRGLAECAATSRGVYDRLGELRELLKPREAPPAPPPPPPPPPAPEPPKEPEAPAEPKRLAEWPDSPAPVEP
ncbi:MAG: hypothetical protein IT452_03335 [Planctomycetia bacterium]|nr:hypothetical protein [Planctomycetia bacterium]